MTKRILRRAAADPSRNEPKCRCGLRRAYAATVEFDGRNRFGLIVPMAHVLSFCSIHGRLYAAKFHLEVQDATTIADGSTEV